MDLNFDNVVDVEDLQIFAEKFLSSGDAGGWYRDSDTSRCIDAGNPACPLACELQDVHNRRIDMGAYGGTPEASRNLPNWSLLSDITNDGITDVEDMIIFCENWLNVSVEQPGDISRDGNADLEDFALFASEWLESTTWSSI